MDRAIIAAEALTLSRSILASMPCGARIASLVAGFVKAALSKEDLYLSFGLDVLLAFDKAGIEGELQGTGVTMEELRPFIKRNALSKLKGPATVLGGKIINIATKGVRDITLIEEAVLAYENQLRRTPLQSSYEVGQAIKFLANGLRHRILDEVNAQKRHRELNQQHEREEDRGGGPSMHDTAAWSQIERKVKNDPDLKGPNGEPWGWIFLDGKSQGLTENEIIDAFNRASPGGKGTVTRSSFLYWMRDSARQKALREIAKAFLDDGVHERLKVAVATGALDVVPLQPFERELLALLA